MSYQIKTVSRLTGIPRNTLLAWERRYALVVPERAPNGYRLYSDADVARLNAVRQLLDQGYKVSEAAALVLGAGDNETTVASGVRVAILHETLPGQLQAAGTPRAQLDVVAAAPTVEALLRTSQGPVDVLVADLGLLGDQPRLELQRILRALETSQAVVTYQFAPQAQLRRMIAAGARLLAEPARASMVVHAVKEQAALARSPAGAATGARGTPPPVEVPASDGPPPERRFTDAQLARFSELRSAISCECPNHLADLVRALVGFEQYSAQCESRSDDDAALHKWLSANTARARKVVEEMLEEVVIRDGMEL